VVTLRHVCEFPEEKIARRRIVPPVTDINGVLGMDFLHKFGAILDLGRNVMRIASTAIAFE
jgi:hypothetical protein